MGVSSPSDPIVLVSNYPPRLLVREATSFHVVGVVGKVYLKPMVNAVFGLRTLLGLQHLQNRLRPQLAPSALPWIYRIRRYHPASTLKGCPKDVPLRAPQANIPRGLAPLLCGLLDGDILSPVHSGRHYTIFEEAKSGVFDTNLSNLASAAEASNVFRVAISFSHSNFFLDRIYRIYKIWR